MIYIRNKELDCKEFSHPLQMYPDLGSQDILPAQYREVCGERCNPDICALPPRLTGNALVEENVRCYPGYDPGKAMNLPKSDRLAALAGFKDQVVCYMPYHEELERKVYEALISAYRKRQYGYTNTSSCEVLSVKIGPSTSVQDIGLIGSAGTGKSTITGIILERIPRAIRHEHDGYCYIQIPCLSTTAQDGDLKSAFIDLATMIGKIIGTDSYENQMRKMGSVAKMESYLKKLIEIFHVGIIIIDEIQNAVKNKVSMFNHILSMTADTGVAVMIIGTEKAVAPLNENLWFSRRFTQLGRVTSDLSQIDEATMVHIINIIWRHQWTNKRYPLSKKIVSTLVEESQKNIDFLTTIFVTAQYLCIESEGTDHELALDAATIKQAASRYPRVRKLIEASSEVIADYQEKKAATLNSMRNDAEAEREKEQKKMMQESVNIFTGRAEIETEIIEALKPLGYIDATQIIKLVKRQYATDPSFAGLDRTQQIRVIVAQLMQLSEKPLKKKKAQEKTKDNSLTAQKKSEQETRTQQLYGGQIHGIDSLQAATS